jgi:hypothetical protein
MGDLKMGESQVADTPLSFKCSSRDVIPELNENFIPWLL